jgi:flagellar basal-body rod modification protein FlgD
MLDKAMLGIVPESSRNAEYENSIKSNTVKNDIDFGKLMVESQMEVEAQRQKEKAAMNGNELKIGETKNDKEFRDQLEKITGKKQDKAKNKMDKDDYLNLMVTQLKYQDPTKPMENQEMATQLAQFNTVEQLLGVNKLLTQMTEMQTAARSEKLTQYLGTNVQIAGNNLKVSGGRVLNDAFVDLPTKAGNAMVSIKDSGGVVVKTINLGSVESGKQSINWDGTDNKGQPVQAGAYTFSIEANALDGKPIEVKNSVTAKVEGITAITEGGKLDTTAGIIDPKNIIAIRAGTTDSPVAAQPVPAQPLAATAQPIPAQPASAQPATAAAQPMAKVAEAGQKLPDGKSDKTKAGNETTSGSVTRPEAKARPTATAKAQTSKPSSPKPAVQEKQST